MNRGLLLLACLVVATPCTGGSAHAQTDASLGVGAGTARYAGGAAFSSLSFAPAVVFSSHAVYFESSGILSSLPGGKWAAQARANLWAPLLPATRTLRPALAATLVGSAWSDTGPAGVAHVIGEIVWQHPGTAGKWGIALGAGPSLGAIKWEGPVTALRLRGRSWVQRGPVQYTMIAEPTRFFGAWYTDLTAGATLDRGRMAVEVWGLARVSRVYPTTATASAALSLWLSSTVSFEAAAGGYLPEPFQGFPRAGFVSAVIRLHSAPRFFPSRAAEPVMGPLTPLHRGDSLLVRFQMPGARSVAIAGTWTAWRPVPLVPVGSDIWEAPLALAAGTYYFNLVVDGSDWVVPGGVATIGDGMGGLLAILVVP